MKASAGVLLLAVAAAVLVVIARPAAADPMSVPRYLDGPPPGFSGGFGEQSCHACHFTEGLNDPAGEFTIEGVPDRYVGGERYSLVISLARPGTELSGFQLAVRYTDDGGQAGDLEALEESGVAIGDGDESIQYAYQSAEGSLPEDSGVSRWTVVWVAPDAEGEVSFDAAGNAANGDDTAEGDFVYTASASARLSRH